MEKPIPHLVHVRRIRPSLSQILISLLIVGLGVVGNRALSEIDQDLRIMYTEYTLAATDLAHISADIIRYRTTVIRALEAPSKKEFERITGSLPDQRARIQHAIDRYAAASLRVSRSGRSEPQDLEAVRQSLDAYIAAANRTINLLVQLWGAGSQDDAASLRNKAELQAADNAGPKLIQVSLALDRLLETVAEVAKDMRDEGTKTIRMTSAILLLGSLLIALLNLILRRPSTEPPSNSGRTALHPSIEESSSVPLSSTPRTSLHPPVGRP
ncbi:MAG TPA: MCP four helix bundle domain-containing protein [Nitrospiraceae bacterium]|nr:MCP four helix bundle domain-containing protein [Nitrospiraceae bacterium]